MKLEQIQIHTNNIQKTAAFYQNILGLSLLEKSSKSVSIKAGDSILKFIENKAFDSVYHFAFNIPENKLDEAIKWCKNKIDLITIEDQNVIADFEAWNANAVYFYDNNGNLLEFIARHDLDTFSSENFNSESILNISEIGIVIESPLELGNHLIEKYQLDFFSKNANSDAFAAIGDDEGLLIIVKPNRNWYPTQIPSQSNPAEIRIHNHENTFDLFF